MYVAIAQYVIYGDSEGKITHEKIFAFLNNKSHAIIRYRSKHAHDVSDIHVSLLQI